MMDKERYIVHVDMDAFFASVEERDDPGLRGRPIVVGADPKGGTGRGVVAACSYAARKYGIHSAMPISTAYKKCPSAAFIVPHMSKYSRVSREIFGILERFTPDIEPVSVDEAFMDITGSYRHFGTPVSSCRKIKETIKKETGLTASIGLAPNKMTAKIASDIRKPDALVVVTREGLLEFLHPLNVGKLWGVGEKTREALKGMGINTIGDLARREPEELERIFGRNGRHAWELARGIDERTVEAADTVKSVSNEHTFERDTLNRDEVLDALMALSEKVSRRLRKSGLKGRTVTLKIRFSDFRTYTRSETLRSPTNFVDDIYPGACAKLGEFDIGKNAVRLLGVGVSNLHDASEKLDFFDDDTAKAGKKENLHTALGHILDKFGEESIRHRGDPRVARRSSHVSR
ncbi:MAG: DNA polymerase IV [Candidatus Omnitrophota bacterium]